MAALLHPTYLPFTVDQLRGHFAPVLGTGELDRHLTYYLASMEQAKVHADLVRRGVNPTPAQTRLGRQMEKDEGFWLATAAGKGSAACWNGPAYVPRLLLMDGRQRWQVRWNSSSRLTSRHLPAIALGFVTTLTSESLSRT